MTVPPASPRALRPALCALLLAVVLALLSPVAPARAAGGYLCTGYASCASAGYPHHGYKQHNGQMWWRMFSGHNCTNYVAYRLVGRGMSAERPWTSTGMAYNWGRVNPRITDNTPKVGAVAWWNAGDGVGSSGHVAYVEQVIGRRTIVISEDSWGGDFHWRVVRKADGRWPTGFIHFLDEEVEMTRAPEITGAARVGAQLVVDAGRWSTAVTPEVQWLAGGEPIQGATSTTFTPGPGLVRKRLSVRVTAKARGYVPASATAAPTTRVQRGEMTATRQPALSGTPRVDEVLTLDTGTVSPTPASTAVLWFADGNRIEGASGTRLRLGQQLIAKQITARVVSRLAGYRRLPLTTVPSQPVRAGRFQVSEPFTLAGRARRDARLTIQPGTFAPHDAAVTYTWLRDGDPIAGATGLTYVPGVDDVGHRVTVRVTLRRSGYRDLALALDPGSRVATKPTLAVRTVGRVRRAVVRVRVDAPGVADPGGRVVVRLGRRQVLRHDVVGGVARVVFRRPPAGERRVRVRYFGADVVLGARHRTTVRVPRR